MRCLAIALTAFILSACSQAPPPPATSPEVVEFLLTSAATDFQTHHPPDPVRFRDVRIARAVNADGKERYMLCGQFLPAQQDGKAEWMSFATIKTSGYEQWLGGQAIGFCQGSSLRWDTTTGDLSSSLQSRFASLR